MKTDDILLIAYVDGDLPPQDRQEVEKEIGSRRGRRVAERVALLQASRLPYQEAFAHQKLPPVPESLTRKIEENFAGRPGGGESSRDPAGCQ